MTQPALTYRRIGAILIERGFVTDSDLEAALAEQEQCGRPVGEILVDRYGLDRLHLADALALQWEEIRSVTESRPPAPVGVRRIPPSVQPPGEQELRDLLAEAQAARNELESKTDELSMRLAALESLVADVSTALAEIRPSEKPQAKKAGATGKPPLADEVAPTRSAGKPSARRTRTATA